MDNEMRERLRAAQMRDVIEMKQIYAASGAGQDPDEACEEIVGSGRFYLSPATKLSLCPTRPARPKGPIYG